MAASLFITGATGFIGRRLLPRLNPEKYNPIFCLTRSDVSAGRFSQFKDARWVVGNLSDPASYEACLNDNTIVVHLAATTGKALQGEYFAVNADGTRRLVNACKQRGVQYFLHVSTIAVKYNDVSFYHYAESKRAAEEAVARGGLSYTIVRPTIVLAPDSPAWKSLSKLARLPYIPVLGDGTPQVQPIYVDDIADALLAVVEERSFHNEIYDMGGPNALTINALLQKLHDVYAASEARFLHIRPRLVLRAVSFAERFFSRLIPFNAGQLSFFLQDGTVERNELHTKRLRSMKDLDSILRILATHETTVN